MPAARGDRQPRQPGNRLVQGLELAAQLALQLRMPASSAVRQGLASGVTLYYAGNASPDEWSAGTGAAIACGRQGFTTFHEVFTQQFPGVHYDDGNAMMGYDALLTATSAIRLTPTADPTPADVIQELGALQGTRAVLGASGPIVLNTNYLPPESAHGSNPVGKAVPVLRLAPNGTVSFVELDWPEGQPPASC